METSSFYQYIKTHVLTCVNLGRKAGLKKNRYKTFLLCVNLVFVPCSTKTIILHCKLLLNEWSPQHVLAGFLGSQDPSSFDKTTLNDPFHCICYHIGS